MVGGTGPESTIMYYKKLNSDIDKLTEGKTMPDIAIESVNFRKAWDYVSNGIEGIILGCTELPLIFNSGNCPVRCFDAVDIHLKKLVSLAMK